MVTQEILDEIKDRFVATYNPLSIYLFGSCSRGTQTEESDVDLLVVVNESSEASYTRACSGHRALADLMVSKDLLVYTKDEFDRFSSDATRLSYTIKRDGKLIYAKS